MTALVTEILGWLALAALIGFLLGYLVWGWGRRERIDAARAEGAGSARSSGGDPGVRARLQAAADERARLEAEVARLTERLSELEGARRRSAPAGSASNTEPAAGPAMAGEADASAAAAEARRESVGGVAAAGMMAPGGAGQVPPGTADPTGPRARGGDSPDMPRPAAFTQSRQRAPGPDEAPVADEQVPPEPDGTARAGGAVEPGIPRAADATLRTQRPAGRGEPPVADEQVPPQGEDAVPPRPRAEPPRPADATLQTQRTPGPEEPPITDEQVPPGAGGTTTPAAGPGPEMPRPPETTRRSQRQAGEGEPRVSDEQVPPDGGPAAAPPAGADREAATPPGEKRTGAPRRSGKRPRKTAARPRDKPRQ